MKASMVIKILTKAIPKEAEWSQGELYGAYGVDENAEIEKILYCVTPTREVLEHFRTHKYDLLISHHPYKMKAPQLIFHTALDCCEGGLNDQWRDALDLKDAKHFDGNLGWYGKVEPIKFSDLIAKCEKFMGQKIIGQVFSDTDIVESVVICSGLGGMVTEMASKTKADCYILGEATGLAKDMGFKAVIETGHTISEQMGVNLIRKALPLLQVDLAPLEKDYFGHECYLGRKRH